MFIKTTAQRYNISNYLNKQSVYYTNWIKYLIIQRELKEL